jgi:hypothetical protein
MNDRLLELAIQSGVVESNVDWQAAGGDLLEKFAELIAKEILNISDEVIDISDSPEWDVCERLGINHDWRRQDNFWS